MSKEEVGDIEFLSRPSFWPRWPVLPVKRYTSEGSPECGICWAGDGAVVYKANIYSLPLPRVTKKDLAGLESYEYLDFEAMVDDGWVVD